VSPRERRADRGRTASARPSPAAVAAPGIAPQVWRDPWALATVLATLPLLARCAGAPLGEAVAEDFDFLRRSLFLGVGSLLDGGGSTAFWRPLAHQLYYAGLGPLIVAHPRAVAALHLLLLAAGSLLVFRALRPHLGGPAACVAATFPMLSESTRTLVSWPSQFVDVGLYFFSAVALHATARRRLPAALAATLLALLCKELAVVTALLLACFPDGRDAATRRRWAIALGALVVVWAGAYLAVRSAAGLHLPHGIEQNTKLAATSWLMRMSWAIGGSVRALASLPLASAPEDPLAIALAAGLLIALGLRCAASSVRARLRARGAWIAWGGAWFAAGALVVGRGALLFLAPGAATTISEDAPDLGAFMDFARLTRLQRFMALTRTALHQRYPEAPPRAHVVEMNLPRGLIYAFGGDRAVQVWYRDTTLSMVNYARLNHDSTLSMVAGVQFQPNVAPQIVLLSPDAMRAQDRAFRQISAGHWAAGFAPLALADSLTPDPGYVVFHGDNAGYRAFALLQLNRYPEAEAEARRSLALNPTGRNGLLVLGSLLGMRGQFDEALEKVDHLLRLEPGEASAQRLRAAILAKRDAERRP